MHPLSLAGIKFRRSSIGPMPIRTRDSGRRDARSCYRRCLRICTRLIPAIPEVGTKTRVPLHRRKYFQKRFQLPPARFRFRQVDQRPAQLYVPRPSARPPNWFAIPRQLYRHGRKDLFCDNKNATTNVSITPKSGIAAIRTPTANMAKNRTGQEKHPFGRSSGPVIESRIGPGDQCSHCHNWMRDTIPEPGRISEQCVKHQCD